MSNDVHVYPLNDLDNHIVEGDGDGASCPCNPKIEIHGADLLYIHNSFDGREIVEELREELGI